MPAARSPTARPPTRRGIRYHGYRREARPSAHRPSSRPPCGTGETGAARLPPRDVPPQTVLPPPRAPGPPGQAGTHHYSIYNIVTVVLQGTDCLCSGHVGLGHHQLNVFHLDAGFVNLKETEPGIRASPTHGLLRAWQRKMGLSGLGQLALRPHRRKLGGKTGHCPALGTVPRQCPGVDPPGQGPCALPLPSRRRRG